MRQIQPTYSTEPVSRSVGDAVTLFVNDRRAMNAASATITKYESMLRRVLEPVLDRSCAEITTDEIQGLVLGLRNSLTPATVNSYMRTVKAWVNYCIVSDIQIGVNPKRLKQMRTVQPLPPHLSEQEMQVLLAAPDRKTPYGCRDHALLALLLDTGLRINAAMDIRIEDIHGDRIVVMDKGRRGREVAISDSMRDILTNWIGVRQVYLGEHFPQDTEYLFPGRGTSRLSNRQAETIVKQYGRQAGISQRVYPHLLRSTYATQVTRSGMGMEHLRKNMGWTSLAMVKVYVNAFDTDAQEQSRIHSPLAGLMSGHRGRRRKASWQL